MTVTTGSNGGGGYDNEGSVGRYSVAPMMDVTDRHFRVLSRLISRRATMWTEMVVDRTLIHNAVARAYELPLPRGGDSPHPTVLQLGGSEPDDLAAAAKLAADAGYVEVNLNCGCPSPRVAGKGCFGAALMKQPEDVAEMMRKMRAALPNGIEVSVKHRLGVDSEADYEHTKKFVEVVGHLGGVRHFIVHARAALLNGINPKQNRTIPPLRHDNVLRLVEDFPDYRFTLNGGVATVAHVRKLLDEGNGLSGVMVGRAVRDAPWAALADVDSVIYGDPRNITRRSVLEKYAEYADEERERSGCPQRVLVKPALNLFHGEPRGKMFRRACDDAMRDTSNSVSDILLGASEVLFKESLDTLPPSMMAADSGRKKESILIA